MVRVMLASRALAPNLYRPVEQRFGSALAFVIGKA
jgi:hypothetical protein